MSASLPTHWEQHRRPPRDFGMGALKPDVWPHLTESEVSARPARSSGNTLQGSSNSRPRFQDMASESFQDMASESVRKTAVEQLDDGARGTEETTTDYISENRASNLNDRFVPRSSTVSRGTAPSVLFEGGQSLQDWTDPVKPEQYRGKAENFEEELDVKPDISTLSRESAEHAPYFSQGAPGEERDPGTSINVAAGFRPGNIHSVSRISFASRQHSDEMTGSDASLSYSPDFDNTNFLPGQDASQQAASGFFDSGDSVFQSFGQGGHNSVSSGSMNRRDGSEGGSGFHGRGTDMPFKSSVSRLAPVGTVCQICGEAFLSNRRLQSHHMKVHGPGEQRRHRCPLCGKTFSQRGALTTHIRIHTGEKPFCCAGCGKSYGDYGNFCRHRKTCPRAVNISM